MCVLVCVLVCVRAIVCVRVSNLDKLSIAVTKVNVSLQYLDGPSPWTLSIVLGSAELER